MGLLRAGTSSCLRVRTDTGFLVPVWRWTDVYLNNLNYHPVRPGCARTTLTWAGFELTHATVYLDDPNVPGAAYAAISRVSFADEFLIGGKVTGDHLTPVHRDEVTPNRASSEKQLVDFTASWHPRINQVGCIRDLRMDFDMLHTSHAQSSCLLQR